MSLGLQSGTVDLAPYSESWRELYEEERRALADALGDRVLDIQHVGSTSVPGMVAKPILDIGIAVRSFMEAACLVPDMENLNYEYRGEFGIPRRHYYVKGEPRTHHVHIFESSSYEWASLVLFRNVLLTEPEVAKAYSDLKKRLRDRHRAERTAYQRAKASFVEEVVRHAIERDQTRRWSGQSGHLQDKK